MSAIAGVLYRDGRPATTEELIPAITAMATMAGDGINTFAEGSVALAHLALHTTPEAVHEVYPLRNERGDWLVADARIDNRDALIRALRLSPTSERPITDADLILAAHERWNNGAPVHLIGDYAYAYWEAATHTLNLVRSPFAPKQLFYRVTPQGIVFASTVQGVQALTSNCLTENTAWFASFITLDMERFFNETAFSEIQKVPPAFDVRWTPRRNIAAPYRFWQLMPDDKYDGWSDERWRETFLATFEEAVAVRLRSNSPITMAVSGGIDSSSIACVAHRLMHDEHRIPVQPTYLYTDRMVGWPETEEGEYRDIVMGAVPQFHNQWLDVPKSWTWNLVHQWHPHASAPFNLSSAFWCAARMEAARGVGSRVQLNGLGGDFITGEEDYGVPQALYGIPLKTLVPELRHFLRNSPRGALKFGKTLAATYLPENIFRRIERARGQFVLYTEEAVRDQGDRSDAVPPMIGGTPLQQRMNEVLTRPLFHIPVEQIGELFLANGIEHRLPFYHRPFVELCFHIPPHLRRHGGETRLLLKRALANDFPRALLERNSKAGFSRYMAFSPNRTDHEHAMRLPANAISLHRGWIDRDHWQTAAARPKEQPMAVIFAHRIAHMEAWRHTAGL